MAAATPCGGSRTNASASRTARRHHAAAVPIPLRRAASVASASGDATTEVASSSGWSADATAAVVNDSTPSSVSKAQGPSPSVIQAILAPVQRLARLLDYPDPSMTASAASASDQPQLALSPLPEKNLGVLRGGRWPFTYDPVYGLPVVTDVWTYGQVLRGMREGQVEEVLWFQQWDARTQTPMLGGRCLLRLRNGHVAQSSLPSEDLRLKEALRTHACKSTIIPLEPRQTTPDSAPYAHPYARWYSENVGYMEEADAGARRGPRVGPTDMEMLATLPEYQNIRDRVVVDEIAGVKIIMDEATRLETEEWDAYEARNVNMARLNNADISRMDQEAASQEQGKKASWMDNIIVSQNTQAMIVRYVPILGPIVGSAFIIGLYMLSRLVKGDLTDRMNVMGQEEAKRKQQQLKEARIAFLEEELPALVAKGISLADIRKKAVGINAKLGPKLEIADSDLANTYEACMNLLKEGTDLSGAASSSSAADRILAEEDARERAASQKEAQSEGGDAQQSDFDALMDMGKLNTARVRKATDPRIMEVKRRVRQARRAMKRESKVQLSDEIIFFDDVAGNEQAKIELLEIVDFFKQPQKFKASGARAPKGVLLVGPPGNGKTLMARAVAGESGVAFISSSASEFIEMYMGLGAARVRDLFQTARKLAPCVIFIDELDAVGRARRGAGGGNDERDTTVNQLLTELDGFEAEQQGIVVMGATNRKDVLDVALTRAGRFDRSIEVRRPDYQGRLEGCMVHLRDKPLASDVDYKLLARMTGGMSGAQLAGMCNTSAFIASRAGRSEITQADLRNAVEQSKYGRVYDVRTFVSPARRRRLAVMEGGISLAASLLPAIEGIDYVTIMPSGKSPVGRTVLKADVGRYTTGIWTKRYLTDQLQLALAGRAAEELVFGFEELSSLNQHRLMLARQIATKMMNAGMSQSPDYTNLRTLGDQYYDPSFEPGRFALTTITHDLNQTRSEWVDTDMEMEALLNGSYARVKDLLQRNRDCLDQIVDVLVERERISGEEVQAVVTNWALAPDLEAKEKAKEMAVI